MTKEIPYWRRPNHTDANPNKIAERMEDRAYRNERRDELHLGRGLHSPRLRRYNERERVFAKSWMTERNMLRHLLVPYPATEGRLHYVTKREAEVAASIIQWLGSNVGFAFLCENLDKLGYKVVKK